ncbi:hypothetical protein D3C71_1590370 [compost metagenome]
MLGEGLGPALITAPGDHDAGDAADVAQLRLELLDLPFRYRRRPVLALDSDTMPYPRPGELVVDIDLMLDAGLPGHEDAVAHDNAFVSQVEQVAIDLLHVLFQG